MAGKELERTAEHVNGGSWAKYFEKLGLGFFDREKYDQIVSNFQRFYSDFHERTIGNPEGQTLLELGVGTGASALPLVKKGYRVIGLDNDKDALSMARNNAQLLPRPEDLKLVEGDLYDPNWHKQFREQNIAGVVSYGVLEHFTDGHLKELMKQQFEISSTVIAMMPINTPRSLDAFKAKAGSNGDIDENGIYRRFLTETEWINFFESNEYIIRDFSLLSNSKEGMGTWDMIIFSLSK